MMDAIVKELREYDTDYPAFELMDKAADAIDSLRARLAKYEDAEGRPFKCQTCQDSGVVSTTDKDHNGDHIEQRCPACAGEAFQCEHAACQSLGEHHPFCEYVTQVSAGGVDERAEFESWHNQAYGPQDKYNPIRSLAYDSAGVGLGYDDTTVMAQFHAFKGALALSAPSHGEQVRDGWQWVPVEPNEAIRDAINLLCDDHSAFDDSDAFWSYLLAAAPSAGSQGGDV